MTIQPREILRYPNYVFPDGGVRDKYLVILASSRADDWIVARSTSQPRARPMTPACNHGHDPSFYVGTIPGIFQLDTWICLDRLDELDPRELWAKAVEGSILRAGALEASLFCALLDCATRADDTTQAQSKALADLRSELGCG